MKLGLGLGLESQRTAAPSPADVLLELNPLVAIGSWWPGSWLNASGAPVANGEAVATTLDQSDYGNHFSQGTVALRPLFDATSGPNGIGCLVLDGVDDVLERTLTGVGSPSGATVVWVAKANSDPSVTSRDGSPFDGFKTETLGSHIPYYGTGDCYSAFATTTRKHFNPVQSLANWHICTIRSMNGAWQFGVNGVVEYTTSTNTFGISSLFSAIGALVQGSSSYWPYWGKISGLLLYPTHLDDTQLAAKHAALSAITGIST